MEPQASSYLFWIVLTILIVAGAIWGLIWRYRLRLARTFDPQRGKFAKVDGLEIHYQQAGAGPDLLLLHGIGASTFTWRLLIPHLIDQFRVTAVDLPGFGASTKDPTRDHGLEAQSQALIELMDQLKIRRASLVGSSMGGAISLWMAKTYPERIEKVIVLAPAVHPRLLPLNLAIFSKFVHPSTRMLLTRPLFRQILKRVLTKEELISDETIGAYLRPYAESGAAAQTFMKATKVLSDRRLPDALRGIQAPVHILYGDNDLMVPRGVIESLQQVLPNATLQTHPQAGHHPHEDEPAWVASQIKQQFR